MNKFTLTLLLLTVFLCSYSQEKRNDLSIEFKEITRKSAIEIVEKSTDYKFYFDNNWFKNDSTLITKQYTNTSIETILNGLFDKTNLNYFIKEKK